MFALTTPTARPVDIIGMLTPQTLLVLTAAVLISFAPFFLQARNNSASPGDRPASSLPLQAQFTITLLLTLASLVALVSGSFSPFIYFQF
jgi:hypothetical protein